MKESSPTEAAKRIPVLVINGFLGSGKTTLLTSLLAQSIKKQLSVGVVVNDMSELDVDGLLVAQREFFEKDDCSFESIYSCVLSSRQGITKLEHALGRITQNSDPELLIIETSGSCHPLPLVEFFSHHATFCLTGVLVLVDGAMIDQDYDGGQQLLPTMQRNVRSQRRDMTNLLVEQIMFCSHLMLTKADRIPGHRIEAIARSIHDLNPFVPVVSLPWGNLPVEDVLAMPEYDYHRVAQLTEELKPLLKLESEEDRPHNMATRVIKDDRPFHPQRLWDACQQHLGQRIYRSKGFFYMPSRDHLSLLWNQAAGGIDLEIVGYWRAAVLEEKDSRFDEQELEGLRQRLAEETGRFGDRRCQLTVIGDEAQVDYFAASLRRCFLNEEEIELWQSGGEFPDPWPENYVRRTC